MSTAANRSTIASPETAALQARYGHGEAIEARWNDTVTALLAHRSVRAYSPDPVPAGTLEAIVAAAQSAPTSSNLQTWSVLTVDDKATRKRLAEIARGQKHIEECPLFLVWLADLSRLEELGRRKSAPTEALPYLESFMFAMIDAALAAQNATVALESFGLGSVYIGALRNNPTEVASLLGLPKNVMAVFGQCIGYPDPARPAAVKPRLPQSVVLHRERYSAPSQPAVDGYDERLAAFQRSEGMATIGWSKMALERVGGIAALTGRDRIREEINTLGFDLR